MRTISGMILAVSIGLAAGCGGEKPTPPAEPKSPLTGDPVTPGTTTPTTPSPPSPPAMPQVGWEMDPAKHVIPTIPVAGVVAGQAFAPEVSFFDRTLTFRVFKEGQGQRAVEVTLPPDVWKDLGSVRLVVKSDQKEGGDVPRVQFDIEPPGTIAKPDAVNRLVFPNGYALTLDLKKQDKNRYAGRICLSLPDEAKSFIAGEFTVTRIRASGTPPGVDDTPFVQGKLAVVGSETPVIETGYVGSGAGGQYVQGQLDFPFSAKDQYTYAEFTESPDHQPRGRVTSIAAPKEAVPHGHYEHTRLAPSRYLVYGRVVGGPVTWKWMTVEANSQLTADFTIDPTKTGNLEVAVPTGFTGDVRLAPADDPAKPLDAGLFIAVAVVLKLEAKPKDGKATFARLGPGVYEVHAGAAGDLHGTVEVKPGETAKIELKKK